MHVNHIFFSSDSHQYQQYLQALYNPNITSMAVPTALENMENLATHTHTYTLTLTCK